MWDSITDVIGFATQSVTEARVRFFRLSAVGAGIHGPGSASAMLRKKVNSPTPWDLRYENIKDSPREHGTPYQHEQAPVHGTYGGPAVVAADRAGRGRKRAGRGDYRCRCRRNCGSTGSQRCRCLLCAGGSRGARRWPGLDGHQHLRCALRCGCPLGQHAEPLGETQPVLHPRQGERLSLLSCTRCVSGLHGGAGGQLERDRGFVADLWRHAAPHRRGRGQLSGCRPRERRCREWRVAEHSRLPTRSVGHGQGPG